MKSLFFSVAASSSLLLVAPQALMAQTPLPTELSPILVRAVSPQEGVHFSTNPKLPRQPIPASDAGDYLQTIPGFSAIRSGASNSDPVLRGMFGSRLLVLTNGGSMPGACPSRMDSPSSYISPQTFDEITVIKGPQSVIWGPGASAGTVHFKRNPPEFTQADATLEANLQAGSWGRHGGTADFAAGNEAFYVRLTANQDRAQDYKDGAGQLVPSRWKKWNTDLSLGWRINQENRVEISAGTGDGYARYAGRGMDGTKFRRDSLGVRFEHQASAGALQKIEAQLYQNHADHLMDNHRLRVFSPASGMRMPMDSNVDRKTWGGRLSGEWKWQEKWSLIAGLDAQNSRHRQRSAMGAQHYSQQAWFKDASFEQYGIFAQTQYDIKPGRRWVGGLRLDRHRIADLRPTIGSGMMKKPNPGFDQHNTKTLPGAFIRYEHDLQQLPMSLYAGIGHTQRMPDYWELFSPGRGPHTGSTAFLDIRPEKTTQLDLGLQYSSDALSWWGNAYIGQIQDYILFEYSPSGMMGMSSEARNIKARIMGAELGLDYAFDAQWKIGANMAYAWGKNTSNQHALPQMPPLDLRLNLDYTQGAWSSGVLWRWVNKQSRYALRQGNVVGKDFGPTSAFSTWSLYSAYQVSKSLSLSAGIDNVLNKTYSEHLNMAGNAGFGYAAGSRVNDPGRTLWLQASLAF